MVGQRGKQIDLMTEEKPKNMPVEGSKEIYTD
jgi:hypothetical protein